MLDGVSRAPFDLEYTHSIDTQIDILLLEFLLLPHAFEQGCGVLS